MNWIFKMAWREGRAIFQKVILFILSIAVGIAALVATNSLQENLKTAVHDNAKTLLGADLIVSSRFALPSELESNFQSENIVHSKETMFNSMAIFPKSGQSRLVVVRAIEGEFPYYGDMITEPAEAAQSFRTTDTALLEESLFLQFGLEIGDSIQIGQKEFQIAGKLIKNAGEVMGSFFAAPRVFIARRYVPATKLIQTGSLRRQKIFIRESSPSKLNALMDFLKPLSEQHAFRIERVADRQEQVGSGTDNLSRFLNLASFIVLLLGGIGVASSVHVYVQQKRANMAVLKCLGATGQQGLMIYTSQALGLGLLGAGFGTAAGILLQKFLIYYLSPVLPIPLVFSLSWKSIINGFVIGGLAAALFSLIPLIPIQHVSPLNALRASAGLSERSGLYPSQKIIFTLILLFVYGFAFYHLKQPLFSLLFVFSLLLVLFIFWGAATALIYGLKRLIQLSWPYPLRQGLSNLYRPQNQTTLLLMCLGFGVFFILIIVMTHTSLLKKFSVAAGEGRPNMGLFDIGTEKLPHVKDVIQSHDMPVLQSVPIVSMRLHSINNVPRAALKQDERIPNWTLRHQYRSTYRNQLNHNEELIDGQWHADLSSQSPFPISIEKGIAKDLRVKVGDEIVFDVAGRLIQTRLSSVREVDWYQIQPTFFFVFPEGALEKAPQFHVLSTHAQTPVDSARLQKAVAAQFPEVSVIDLRIVLDIVDKFVSQLSVAIRFVAILIIVAGFIMLAGALATSRYQRQEQTALLRTLGARQHQIAIINVIEYMILGSLAVVCGIFPAMLVSWGLTEFIFESEFYFNVISISSVGTGVVLITMVIAFLNFWPILKQSPMIVLREE